jgi:hypothetical protein
MSDKCTYVPQIEALSYSRQDEVRQSWWFVRWSEVMAAQLYETRASHRRFIYGSMYRGQWRRGWWLETVTVSHPEDRVTGAEASAIYWSEQQAAREESEEQYEILAYLFLMFFLFRNRAKGLNLQRPIKVVPPVRTTADWNNFAFTRMAELADAIPGWCDAKQPVARILQAAFWVRLLHNEINRRDETPDWIIGNAARDAIRAAYPEQRGVFRRPRVLTPDDIHAARLVLHHALTILIGDMARRERWRSYVADWHIIEMVLAQHLTTRDIAQIVGLAHSVVARRYRAAIAAISQAAPSLKSQKTKSCIRVERPRRKHCADVLMEPKPVMPAVWPYDPARTAEIVPAGAAAGYELSRTIFEPDGQIRHYRVLPAVDWARIIKRLPDGPRKNHLLDVDRDISDLTADSEHRAWMWRWQSGRLDGRGWTSKPEKRWSVRGSVTDEDLEELLAVEQQPLDLLDEIEAMNDSSNDQIFHDAMSADVSGPGSTQ